jgi:hypothetical protein
LYEKGIYLQKKNNASINEDLPDMQ